MPYSQPVTPGPGASVQQVRGTFATDTALAEAVRQLGKAGFDRSRLTLPPGPPGAPRHSEQGPPKPPAVGAEPAKTEDDGRQLRTLRTSTTAAAAAMAGAAAVVATGGAAAAAIAAAAGAGLAAGGGMYAANNAADLVEADERTAASPDGLVLVVAASNPQELDLAERTLLHAGAQAVAVEHQADARIVGQGVP
jgi:hypothetical protein